MQARRDVQGLLALSCDEKIAAEAKAASAMARAEAADLACEKGTKVLLEETMRLTRLLEAALAR